MKSNEYIIIKGAKSNNLKNISIKIPKNKLVVITGVSGSGKSTLAYDTIYAESERRYVESLSSYARQFLRKHNKPKFDEIKGLSPSISIKARTSINNPRSTVGTITDIYHYLTLLYERMGVIISPISGKEVKRNNFEDFKNYIYTFSKGFKYIVCCEIKKSQLDYFYSMGYSRLIINSKMISIDKIISSKKKYKKILLIIDRLVFNNKTEDLSLLNNTYSKGMELGNDQIYIYDSNFALLKIFNKKLEMDNIVFQEPTRQMFNFNNAYGACEKCQGHGDIIDLDEDKIIPYKELSFNKYAVHPWKSESMSKWKNQFILKSKLFKFPLDKPYKNLSNDEKNLLWNGNQKVKGIRDFFNLLEKKSYKIQYRVMLSKYRGKTKCDACNGSRLKENCKYIFINNININNLINLEIPQLFKFINKMDLLKDKSAITNTIITEIKQRIDTLINLGLGYLTLNRKSSSLSGGEMQRINIAKSIGSVLVGSLYILDEPTIGLHPKDTNKLINTLIKLKDQGNSVIVVEHDKQIMKRADHLIDLGPWAGERGGQIVYEGPSNNKLETSLTLDYIHNRKKIKRNNQKRRIQYFLSLTGVEKNNLNGVKVHIPLKVLTAITGLSGAGKTTLLKDVIFPAIKRELKDFSFKKPKYDKLKIDLNKIANIEFIDQNSIKKSSKSTPITYIKAFKNIRELFASQKKAQLNSLNPKHFSFNTKGGRCEKCKGLGYLLVEMQFLADMKLECRHCLGTRYTKEILSIKFKNKSIHDILNMTIDQAFIFFQNHNYDIIASKLIPLKNVGLGYIRLGQTINTFSSGELQRLKLASFINEKQKNSILIFDEPSKGLHFHDVQILIDALQILVNAGNTIIVIEHNTDIIKNSDWVIDMGPDSGDKGGKIIFSGLPQDLQKENSHTGLALKDEY
ncbi:MAG: excinuclease ABC subunit A [Flavobacteriales bacterium]|nr:excinuclease ABC subunit A [Flavobacteriales bacterium]